MCLLINSWRSPVFEARLSYRIQKCFPLGISRVFQLVTVSAITSGAWKSSPPPGRPSGRKLLEAEVGACGGWGSPSPAGSAGSWGQPQEMPWTQGPLQAAPGRPLLLNPQAVSCALPSRTQAPVLVTQPLRAQMCSHPFMCRHLLNCVNKCMLALVRGGHCLHRVCKWYMYRTLSTKLKSAYSFQPFPPNCGSE